MIQQDLFEKYREPIVPTPPHNGTDTSRAAAESVRPTAAEQRERVYTAIVRLGDATDEEIGDATGIGGDSVRPRRGELAKAGRIALTGEQRPTRKGRAARVWRAV